MKFVKEKESNKQSFLERFLGRVIEARKVKDKVLADFRLVENPKVGARGWVARLDPETGNLTFLRAEEWRDTGGAYLLNPGDIIIEKMNCSSWKHSCESYTLYRVTQDDVDEIAHITYIDRAPEFSDETLEEIYVTTPKVEGKLRAVQALIAFAKTQLPPEKPLEEVGKTITPA